MSNDASTMSVTRRLRMSAAAVLLCLAIVAAGAAAAQAEVSAGVSHTCTLAAGGTVYCAGDNSAYELGESTTLYSATPIKLTLPSGLTATKVSAGDYQTCVVASNSEVYCVGINVITKTVSAKAVEFTLPSGLTARSVANQGYGVCVLASNSQVYCAGTNKNGQFGDGTTTEKTTPVRFGLAAGLTALGLYGAFEDNCVLASDHQVYCAGGNSNGQLSNGTTVSSSTPVRFQLPAGLTATQASTGLGHTTCVTASDGNAYCAGSNADGQLGDGTTTDRYTAVRFALTAGLSATGVSTGSATTCVLASAQSYCAGYNVDGQLGNGSTTNSSTPVHFQLPGGLTATQVTNGADHSCVQASNRQSYCAGSNSAGQLGNDSLTNSPTAVEFLAPAS